MGAQSRPRRLQHRPNVKHPAWSLSQGFDYSVPLFSSHAGMRGTTELDCLHYCSFGLPEVRALQRAAAGPLVPCCTRPLALPTAIAASAPRADAVVDVGQLQWHAPLPLCPAAAGVRADEDAKGWHRWREGPACCDSRGAEAAAMHTFVAKGVCPVSAAMLAAQTKSRFCQRTEARPGNKAYAKSPAEG